MLHPINFVNIINGNFSMLTLNETPDLSKFIAGLWVGGGGELCFPIPFQTVILR